MSHSIPSNQNSQRASSRKNRVYTFHSFLSETYSDATKILDVAGGRGDLSFLLRNVNGVDSIIADPRVPNFTRLIKSINFLFQHPEEAKVRAVEGRMTYQPLAKLIPHLFERHICAEVGGHKSGAAQISIPKNLRLHVDGNLVKVLQSVMLFHNEEPLNSPSWDEYWTNETKRIASNKSYYGGTSPKQKAASSYESNQIEDSRMALKTFMSLNLIVGFHPDQATEAAIDMAITLQIPFAIVPCCVFPSEFPNRKNGGEVVKSYHEFLQYLMNKHNKMRTYTLHFIGSDTGKNVVVYMLKEDFVVDNSKK